MAWDDNVTLDQLTDKHELLFFDPTEPADCQVLQIEHDGQFLEVIVPLFYDNMRVGEIVSKAVVNDTVFLLCRFDKPFSDLYGTLGFLVVAVPHGDGRYHAVIAHTTYAFEKLKLYPRVGAPD